MRRLAVLFCAVLGCTKNDDRDAQFWAWFQAHGAEVATIKTGTESIAEELTRELRKIDARLVYQIRVGPPRELAISADGLATLFPTVRRLVAAAPALPGWTIVAFRQRTRMPEINRSGKLIHVTDLSFSLLAPPKPGYKLDVAIFVGGGIAVDAVVRGSVFVILDSWLGEVDTETVLGKVQISDETEKPRDARPFPELVGLVDGQKARP